jgi:hypothetical protein
MDVVEKNRTFLFVDELDSGDRNPPTQCRKAAPMVEMTVGGAGGQDIQLIWLGSESDVGEGFGDEADNRPGIQRIGRFDKLTVPSDEPEPVINAEALVFPNFKTRSIISWDGQQFGAYSTMWENEYTDLFGPYRHPGAKFQPVVDECGQLVGYFLAGTSTKNLFMTDAGEIFFSAQNGYGEATYFFAGKSENIAGKDLYLTSAGNVVGWTEAAYKLSPQEYDNMYHQVVPAGNKADILVDIDGFIVAMNMYLDPPPTVPESPLEMLLGFLLPRIPDDRCLPGGKDERTEECQIQQTMFMVDMMFLFIDILSLGESAVLRKAATKLLTIGARARQALRLAEVGERAAEVAIRGARLGERAASLGLRVPRLEYEAFKTAEVAQTFRRAKGYQAVMGVPEEHFTKMVEAAQETKSIAVFRSNKSAAIPLIRKGAHPKAKYFNAFKSSRETGVLTALEQSHIDTAYEHGYFVVDKDLVARRLKGGKMEELQLKDPFWKVEKGQVIGADGKPVVGDYDLLAVLPEKSPGRNIAEVADGAYPDSLEHDWAGPDTKKYAEALNSKLDQPRVLHGAQDQFQHSKFGGLTDDTAYAVYGDGSVAILEGRQQQEAFFKSYRRQTAMGSYGRRTPGTPLPPGVIDLDAARARRLGGK